MSSPIFRTIELSDPAYEVENLRYLTVKTPRLCGRGDITIFVPAGLPESSRDLPVAILLHGVYGSHWGWTHKAGVHRTAQRMIDANEIRPMLIAMPSDGLMFDGTAYLPHNQRRFDAWIVEDVVEALVAAGLPTSRDAPRFIGGLSMGGYGALRLGVLHADRFAAVAGHSSITGLDQMKLFVEEDLSVYQRRDEPYTVLDAVRCAADRVPPLRFDCGVEDELLEHNRALHNALLDLKVDHIYTECPGGHEWGYWAQHIGETLRFFDAQIA